MIARVIYMNQECYCNTILLDRMTDLEFRLKIDRKIKESCLCVGSLLAYDGYTNCLEYMSLIPISEEELEEFRDLCLRISAELSALHDGV